MITITRLNGDEIMVNASQIESIEIGVDTCISLMNGKRLFVEESKEEIVQRIRSWYQSLHIGVSD
ncbi:MAG: flagellar FlbD family protein [Planctomycetes bacterium]|nr:flagellar FlbD family protein [Planctomycetota bacterium]